MCKSFSCRTSSTVHTCGQSLLPVMAQTSHSLVCLKCSHDGLLLKQLLIPLCCAAVTCWRFWLERCFLTLSFLQTGTVAFTSPQPEEGMKTLVDEAAKVKVRSSFPCQARHDNFSVSLYPAVHFISYNLISQVAATVYAGGKFSTSSTPLPLHCYLTWCWIVPGKFHYKTEFIVGFSQQLFFVSCVTTGTLAAISTTGSLSTSHSRYGTVVLIKCQCHSVL